MAIRKKNGFIELTMKNDKAILLQIKSIWYAYAQNDGYSVVFTGVDDYTIVKEAYSDIKSALLSNTDN